MNFKYERCWSLLSNASRSDQNVNVSELLNSGVHGVLDAELVADVDLMENNRHTILGGKLGGSFVSVLLQHVKDNKSFQVNVAKSVRDVISQSSRTTREKSIVRFETLKDGEGGK
jgi:hypothetical protein